MCAKRKRGGKPRSSRKRSAGEILKDARAALRRVDRAIMAMGSDDEQTQMDGLQDVAMYGRAFVETLETLKGPAPGFRKWWEEKAEQLDRDAVYAYFHDLRNDIAHEGVFEVWVAPGVNMTTQATAEVWAHLAPPGTEHTSIALDGYVVFAGPYGEHREPLPPEMVVRTLTLLHPPAGHESRSASETAMLYHVTLQQLFREAKSWFGHLP
jgi:hypothetical protein